jgi:hypothetical protein
MPKIARRHSGRRRNGADRTDLVHEIEMADTRVAGLGLVGKHAHEVLGEVTMTGQARGLLVPGSELLHAVLNVAVTAELGRAVRSLGNSTER